MPVQNARGLYAHLDQYKISATVVVNDHSGSGPRKVSATNSDFVSGSGMFKATYRPLIAGTYDLSIKLIEDSSLAPVSIQSDAVVAVIIVRIVFISAFLFYCLLLNHSFPTNPNKITNCF